MPVRRILPACLLAALLTLTGFGNHAVAQEAKAPEPAKTEMPDPAKTPAMMSDVKAVDDKATALNASGIHKYADTTWILISTALVMLMMPGLALFYGGMARRKNVLGTMMHTFICLGLVGVQWVVVGYALAFGAPWIKVAISDTEVDKKDEKGEVVKDEKGNPVKVTEPLKAGFVGWSPELVCLGATSAVGVPDNTDDYFRFKGIDPSKATDDEKKAAEAEVAKNKEGDAAAKANRFKFFPNTNIPLYLHAMFQGMFAIITVALISGAFAERVKFISYLIFALIWTTIVYDPLAHMVWSFEWTYLDSQKVNGLSPAAGLFGANCAIDFAGGTVVHIAAGFSGLAAILLLRKRIGYGKQSFHPNSMVLTLLGAGLLWFGWFGFNGGSALYANGQAVSAFTVTQIAAAMAGLSWTIVEWLHRGKPTALGFASGLVAGLVAITPASGFVDPSGALIIGLAAGIVCYLAVAAKAVLGYDDSLDAFGVHGVGGLLGAILTGALVSLPLWVYGSEMRADQFGGKTMPSPDGVGVVFDRSSQIMWQIKAAGFSAVYAFLVTAVLVLIIDKTIGFTVKPKDEGAGLDLSQHGEVGFDMGPDVDAGAIVEPKSASAPPAMATGKADRFTVVLDGADAGKLRSVWADMCKPYEGKPRKEFDEVYKHLTTINGNKFRFRGGNPADIKASLTKLFSDALNQSGLQAHVEH